ncbi:MAG TPA: Fe-S cluster assembly protein HesB [Actinomycetota bacterium]|nr:Fe-S cluster assembly protein HesB [Actinomycetota bacterium]
MSWSIDLPLLGGGGEAVDFARTINSHGVASLPPAAVGDDVIEVTLATSSRPYMVTVRPIAPDVAVIEGASPIPARRVCDEIQARVAHLLRLDEDLSEFYALIENDVDLSWATAGAGRMMRSGTVFEDLVKTICTTNCSWSATVRMVTHLVEHLGEPAADAPTAGARGRTFPTPAAMAEADDAFYREVVRTGYRGAYLRELAVRVASGELDLEWVGRVGSSEVGDDELEARLLELPGVGPYAAAHLMLMLGRYSRLILDSWTRPTFLRIAGMRRARDSTIQRRFRRYGRYAGLAFWLYLTRGWLAPAPVSRQIGPAG